MRISDWSSDVCSSDLGGTIIGAIAGGLAGHEIAGRGDRTVGTIIGGAVGAIAGRVIDKGNDGCRYGLTRPPSNRPSSFPPRPPFPRGGGFCALPIHDHHLVVYGNTVPVPLTPRYPRHIQ